ncbi:MAG: hypothetical protein HND52_09835 [Ignavibacteriae bacterium]|jgi:predicted nucleic-acid-binding Zn-ribbon protein|nr:hypothetical protein [Ignavibacteriota bacterium]NOG98248.1 hypothetical protein [Ignavibacteriota bacterium]
MHNNYLCPHCRGFINIEDEIIFSVNTEAGKPGLISLNTELGNYNIRQNKYFDLQQGKYHVFYCPICHKDLSSNDHAGLVWIILKDTDGKEFNIYFSGIAGEKSTFKVIGDSAEIFGDDSNKYVDYFNLIQMT